MRALQTRIGIMHAPQHHHMWRACLNGPIRRQLPNWAADVFHILSAFQDRLIIGVCRQALDARKRESDLETLSA